MHAIQSLFIDADDSVRVGENHISIDGQGYPSATLNLFVCTAGEEAAGIEVIDKLLAELAILRRLLVAVAKPEPVRVVMTRETLGRLIRDAADTDPGEANEPPIHEAVDAVSAGGSTYVLGTHYAGAFRNCPACIAWRDSQATEAEQRELYGK